MIQARIRDGRVELEEPVPAEWEGQSVKILPLTPDDPMPDLEEYLAALQALGPTEFEPDEREKIAKALGELNELSRKEMQAIAERR